MADRNIRETTMAEHIAAAQGKPTVTDEEIKQTLDALRARAAQRPEDDGSRAAARSVRFYDIYINNPGTTADENWTEFEATIAQGSSGVDPVTETKEAQEKRELEARLKTASIGQGQSYLLSQGLLRVGAKPEGPQFEEQPAPKSDEPSEMQAKISGKPMPDKAKAKGRGHPGKTGHEDHSGSASGYSAGASSARTYPEPAPGQPTPGADNDEVLAMTTEGPIRQDTMREHIAADAGSRSCRHHRRSCSSRLACSRSAARDGDYQASEARHTFYRMMENPGTETAEQWALFDEFMTEFLLGPGGEVR